MLRRYLSIGAVAVLLGLLAGAPRGEAAPDPRAFINDLGTQGIQMLGLQVPRAQRTARFNQLFESDFDVPGIARFALGRYWQALSPDQQQEFLRLFQAYTVAAYSDKLGEFGGGQFQVADTRQDGGETVVSSNVIRPDGKAMHIDWHLIPEGNQYKITDVFVDQVSMKATQREEFSKIIQNNGGQPSAILPVLRQQLQDHR